MAKHETDDTDPRYWPDPEPGDEAPPEPSARRPTEPRPLPGSRMPDPDLVRETGERGHEQREHLEEGHPPGALYGCQGCEAGDCQHEAGDGDDWCVSDRHPLREAEDDELRRERPASRIFVADRGQRYVAGSRDRDADREAGS